MTDAPHVIEITDRQIARIEKLFPDRDWREVARHLIRHELDRLSRRRRHLAKPTEKVEKS